MAFWRWTCTPWKMHCMFCYRKKAQGAEKILCSKGEYPVLWTVLHERDIGRGACHSDGARPLSAGACFDKGASTYKEACSIPHQDFWMWWWSCLQLCCSQTSGRQSVQRWCGSSEELARWARSRTSLGFYWSTWLSWLLGEHVQAEAVQPFYWLSCVGGHKPKSFGSVGRCCGTNDLLPTCRRHQNFAAMALGQTKKHLKKKRRWACVGSCKIALKGSL